MVSRKMWTVLVLCTLLMLGSLGGATASQVQIYGKSLYAGHIVGSGHDGRQAGRGKPHQGRTITKNAIHRSLDLEAFNFHVTPTTSKINLPTIIRLYPPTAKPLHLHANMPLRFGRESSPAQDRPSNPNMPLRFGRDSNSAQERSSNHNMPLRFWRDSDSAHERSTNHNMPLRFGRDSDSGRVSSTNPNMPLRFGRDSDTVQDSSPNMPQRFGRSWKTFRVCPQCSDEGKQVHTMERDGLYWSLQRILQSY